MCLMSSSVIYTLFLLISLSISVYLSIIKHVQCSQEESLKQITNTISRCISMTKQSISRITLANHVKSLNLLNLNIAVLVECVQLDSTTIVSGFVNALDYITISTLSPSSSVILLSVSMLLIQEHRSSSISSTKISYGKLHLLSRPLRRQQHLPISLSISIYSTLTYNCASQPY